MSCITVIGHGYEAGQLTLEAAELLKSGRRIILHTERCGCAEWLREQGVAFETLDALYERCEDFDEHTREAASTVLDAASEGDVIYGVFDVRDHSVSRLLAAEEHEVRVVAGPPAEGSLLARAVGPVQLLEASDWAQYSLSSARSTLVRELDSRELAGEVKLRLMEVYPEESTVFVRFGSGGVARTELYNLDRLRGYDHRTCVLVPAEPELIRLERFDFDRLAEIIGFLCGPDGCPWDRAQTHESLRPYIIEEAYEVVDAIDEAYPDHLYDELGDMLLQVMLHAEIGKRHGEFDIGDMITAISSKMIHRHTHVFGKDHVDGAGEVLELWSRNKMAERGQTTRTESMRDVTRSLPATLRAAKVLKRLEECCRQKPDAGASVEAAANAVRRIEGAQDAEQALGEAMLALMQAARALKLDPEIALNAATDRLISRFERIERELTASGGSFEALSGDMLRKYWDLVKLSDPAESRQE